MSKNLHKLYNINLKKDYYKELNFNDFKNKNEKNEFFFKIISYNSQLLVRFNELVRLFCDKKVIAINLPHEVVKMTVLKSPHVNKKARDQFEMRTYKTYFKLLKDNDKDINLLKNSFKVVNNNNHYKLYIKRYI